MSGCLDVRNSRVWVGLEIQRRYLIFRGFLLIPCTYLLSAVQVITPRTLNVILYPFSRDSPYKYIFSHVHMVRQFEYRLRLPLSPCHPSSSGCEIEDKGT